MNAPEGNAPKLLIQPDGTLLFKLVYVGEHKGIGETHILSLDGLAWCAMYAGRGRTASVVYGIRSPDRLPSCTKCVSKLVQFDGFVDYVEATYELHRLARELAEFGLDIDGNPLPQPQ